MKFLRWLNPVPGVKDFANEFTRPNPHRWRIAAVSAAATFAIFSVMWQEEVIGPPEKPEVIWISTFAPDRSDAEIIAENVANQKLKDQWAAEQARRDREVKEIYRSLGKASGMDVEKIEREAAAERAAEAKAEAAKQAEYDRKKAEMLKQQEQPVAAAPN
jgi:hypothetical protein